MNGELVIMIVVIGVRMCSWNLYRLVWRLVPAFKAAPEDDSRKYEEENGTGGISKP